MCVKLGSRSFALCLCMPGSGNAGSNVSFNSKFVQQELKRLDVVITDLANTEQTLCTLSSAGHRRVDARNPGRVQAAVYI